MQTLKTFIKNQGSYLDLAILFLQIAVALSCIGYASQTLRQKTEINTEALLGWGASPYIATAVPLLLAATFVVLAIQTIRKPTSTVLWSAFSLIFRQTEKVTQQVWPSPPSPLSQLWERGSFTGDPPSPKVGRGG